MYSMIKIAIYQTNFTHIISQIAIIKAIDQCRISKRQLNCRVLGECMMNGHARILHHGVFYGVLYICSNTALYVTCLTPERLVGL